MTWHGTIQRDGACEFQGTSSTCSNRLVATMELLAKLKNYDAYPKVRPYAVQRPCCRSLLTLDLQTLEDFRIRTFSGAAGRSLLLRSTPDFSM
jgi:hypothetical protein